MQVYYICMYASQTTNSQSERLCEEAATCQRIDSERSQEDRMRSLENQITVLTDKLENPPEERRPRSVTTPPLKDKCFNVTCNDAPAQGRMFPRYG